MTTYTGNKNLIEPSAGSYNNTWASPVNSNWSILDNALGGVTSISVTGVGSGSYQLSTAQYTPPNIEFTGALSASLAYLVPAGVGGLWSIFNNTSGAHALTFGVSGGSQFTLPQGYRTTLISDGANMQIADNGTAATSSAATLTAAEAFATTAANNAQSAAISTSEAFATSAANTAQSNAETYAAAQAATAQSNAETFATSAANTAQSNAETYANGTSGSNANGIWFKLPGSGIIVQSGYFAGQPSSPATITLPTAFTTCSSIVVTPVGQQSTYDVNTIAGVTSSFVLNFGAASTAFSWIATGK